MQTSNKVQFPVAHHDIAPSQIPDYRSVSRVHKCRRLLKHEPKHRDGPEPWARAVRHSVGRTAVCTRRQQPARVSAAPAVCTYLTHARIFFLEKINKRSNNNTESKRSQTDEVRYNGHTVKFVLGSPHLTRPLA